MYLASSRCLFCDLERTLRTVGEEVTLNVVHLRRVHERCDRGRCQMLLVELFRRRQVRHERAIVSSDDDRARTRLLTRLDEVDLVEPLARVRRLELLSEVVVAHASRVHN